MGGATGTDSLVCEVAGGGGGGGAEGEVQCAAASPETVKVDLAGVEPDEEGRPGNGEQGKPFPLTETDQVDQAYRENGFNIYVSDRISLNRSLPDIRHPNCKHKLYAEKLPNTSIIIPFHNEGWSSLLRTVHSVLNRSPPQLIAEIILVDDFSDKDVEAVWRSDSMAPSRRQHSLQPGATAELT
ncbi:hypothetical protein INR49_027720, partial [Caranx melampygus]